MSVFSRSKQELVDPSRALPGRAEPMGPFPPHLVLGTRIEPPFPDGSEQAIFGLGCFWGAERRYWQSEGVVTTAVGYAGGTTPNPTYEEVCSGRTGHAEVVLVVFDPKRSSFEALVASFFEGHDPTQGMRQGNDVGTQYRSLVVATSGSQMTVAAAARDRYGALLVAAGFGKVTTEITSSSPFYYAEAYHQQYLAQNPRGYCGLGGTGISCPVGLGISPAE